MPAKLLQFPQRKTPPQPAGELLEQAITLTLGDEGYTLKISASIEHNGGGQPASVAKIAPPVAETTQAMTVSTPLQAGVPRLPR